MSRRYTGKDVELKTLRVEAGFPSAKAAALHFGWPVGTYQTHESGFRSVPPAKRDAYVKAFRSIPAQQPREITGRAGTRLKAARLLRGFRTAVTAINRFGWTKSTYNAHESGLNAIEPLKAEEYALAFQINVQWLREGTAPSGLGALFDEYIASHPLDARWFEKERDFSSLMQFEDPNFVPRSSPVRAAAAPFAQVSIDGRDVVIFREAAWTKDSLKPDNVASKGPAWAIDSELLSEVWHADPSGLRLLVVATAADLQGFVQSGDRLLIDTLDKLWRTGEIFAVLDPQGQVGLSSTAYQLKDPILGRVVLRLGSPVRRSS